MQLPGVRLHHVHRRNAVLNFGELGAEFIQVMVDEADDRGQKTILAVSVSLQAVIPARNSALEGALFAPSPTVPTDMAALGDLMGQDGCRRGWPIDVQVECGFLGPSESFKMKQGIT